MEILSRTVMVYIPRSTSVGRGVPLMGTEFLDPTETLDLRYQSRKAVLMNRTRDSVEIFGMVESGGRGVVCA